MVCHGAGREDDGDDSPFDCLFGHSLGAPDEANDWIRERLRRRGRSTNGPVVDRTIVG